jgi:hypothetical protein
MEVMGPRGFDVDQTPRKFWSSRGGAGARRYGVNPGSSLSICRVREAGTIAQRSPGFRLIRIPDQDERLGGGPPPVGAVGVSGFS